MSSEQLRRQVVFYAGQSRTLAARLSKPQPSPFIEGDPYQQADIVSITATVYSNDNIVDAWNAISVDVSDVISNTLQGWRADAIGYNFKHTIGPEGFPVGCVLGKVVYQFTMADGTQWAVEFYGPVERVP